MKSTISSTGNFSSILFSFLNPFHFFQFYNHSLNSSTLLLSAFLWSDDKDLPRPIGTISWSSSRLYLVLGDLHPNRNRHPLIKCSIGCTYTACLNSFEVTSAFLMTSRILLTFSWMLLATNAIPFRLHSCWIRNSLFKRSLMAFSAYFSLSASSSSFDFLRGFSLSWTLFETED